MLSNVSIEVSTQLKRKEALWLRVFTICTKKRQLENTKNLCCLISFSFSDCFLFTANFTVEEPETVLLLVEKRGKP